MAKKETCILTNMCMVTDGDQILVQDRLDPNWPGITFPGGHVEPGESFVESAIREVKEETGLDISNVRLCGIKQWTQKNGEYRYIIEIKNSGYLGTNAVDRLYSTLLGHGCLKRAVVGTFHNEVTAYMDSTYAELPRSAGFNEAIVFYLHSFFGLKSEGFPFVALQIPTDDYVVNLGTSRLVNYAHEHNIAVQYWTINDPDEMAYLQSIGADAIMTDVPDLGATILNQP